MNKQYDVTSEAIMKRKAEEEAKKAVPYIQWTIVLLLFVGVMTCVSLYRGITTPTTPKVSWNCEEFDAPYEVVRLGSYKVEAHGGVDVPVPDRVKGYAGSNGSPGASVGIEARCQEGVERFYRVRGVEHDGKMWWGWVKQGDIRR